MTQSTETVSQRAYEAAQVLFDDILGDAASYAEFNRPSYREAAVRTLTEAFARFEREVAADKDETIAKLREAFNAGWSALDGERDQRSHNVMSDYERDSLFAGFITSLTSTKKEG